MAVHLINKGEKRVVRGKEVPTGGGIDIEDASLANFLIRRRNFERKKNVASQDDK
jgi:hypothetical protein